MREAWTDERLDDLNHRLDEGFRRIDGDLRALRIETKTEFASLRGEMNARLDRIDDRFEALQRTMVHAAVGMSAAFIAGFAALIGLFATQL
jgi:hypothetical protein